MADGFTKTLKRGDRGKQVALAQEWLTFHGFATSVDGKFGPATELATRGFQTKHELPANGRVDTRTQKTMLSPIEAVQQPIAADGLALGELLVRYARQHVAQHPIEIGGQNRGPWVRLYMNGNEGEAWPWCAGFATWVLRQAAGTLSTGMPHPYNFSCDVLATKAQAAGTFLSVDKPAEFVRVKPGYLFLIRRTRTDWIHVGVVESVAGDAMTTIEGNTNDQGSREGFEVCRRTRSLAGKDYLIV